MKERIITFRDINAKEEEIVISTNAPVEEIKKALTFKEEARGKEEFDYLCDFEIIQEYLEKRNYTFYALDTREKYYWQEGKHNERYRIKTKSN